MIQGHKKYSANSNLIKTSQTSILKHVCVHTNIYVFFLMQECKGDHQQNNCLKEN